MTGHFWKSCEFDNDKFTLEQSQRCRKKKHKADSTEDYKAPEGEPKGGSTTAGAGGASAWKSGTTSAPKPTASTPQSEAKSEQTKVAREIDTTEVEAGSDSEAFGLVCKCEGDTIDLLHDTGTVSNLVPEGKRGMVHNIRNETTSLIGVGGARVMATKTGQAGVLFWQVQDRSRSWSDWYFTQRQFGDKLQRVNPHRSGDV